MGATACADEATQALSFTIDARFSDPEFVHKIDLGRAVCASRLEVNLVVHNESSETIQLPHRTSSCGCLKELPETFEITPGGDTSIHFVVEVGRKEETIHQNIAYWTKEGSPLLQFQFRLDVVSLFGITPNPILIDSEERQTIRVELVPRSADIKIAEWKIAAYGPDLLSSQLVSEGEKPFVELSFDPTRTDTKPATSSVQFQCDRADGKSAFLNCLVRYPHRTVMVPPRLSFSNSAGGNSCHVLINSRHLVSELRQNKPIRIEPIDAQQGSSPIPAIRVEAEPTGDTLTHLEFKAELDREVSSPISVRLRCGDWTHETTAQFANDKPANDQPAN
jgi:hypothetical protein